MILRFRQLAAAIVLATAFVPHAALAADPEKVDKLLALLKPERGLEQVKTMTLRDLDRRLQAEASKKGQRADEAERVRAIVMPKLRKLFDDAFSTEYIRQLTNRIYSEELTDDEVDAAIAFYGSPAGQSMAAKLPTLTKRGADAGMMRMREMEPGIEAAMRDAIAQVREDEKKESAARVSDAVKQVQDAAGKDAVAPGASAASDAGSGAHDGDAPPTKP